MWTLLNLDLRVKNVGYRCPLSIGLAKTFSEVRWPDDQLVRKMGQMRQYMYVSVKGNFQTVHGR